VFAPSEHVSSSKTGLADTVAYQADEIAAVHIKLRLADDLVTRRVKTRFHDLNDPGAADNRFRRFVCVHERVAVARQHERVECRERCLTASRPVHIGGDGFTGFRKRQSFANHRAPAASAADSGEIGEHAEIVAVLEAEKFDMIAAHGVPVLDALTYDCIVVKHGVIPFPHKSRSYV